MLTTKCQSHGNCSPNISPPPAQRSRTLPLVSLDLFPFFRSRQLLNPRLGCFQFDQPRNSDVNLVGLHKDVQIEQYLDLEMQLECKLGNHNSSILSNDRHAASRGTNLPSSPFDCRVNIKYFGGLLPERLGLKSKIKFS